MFELVDGTFRAYKKKDGRIALHSRTYLLIHTNVGFRLSAYLPGGVRAWLKIPERKEVEIEEISFSDAVVRCNSENIMVHDFWMSTYLDERKLSPCVADLRVMFHLSFTGHPSEEPEFFERKVFVVPRF
jgi:hypothetical protein